MADQNQLRERLIKYQQETDCKWKMIANKISVLPIIISDFKNGKKDLWPTSYKTLDEFLTSAGY
jgi:hypothetical protein